MTPFPNPKCGELDFSSQAPKLNKSAHGGWRSFTGQVIEETNTSGAMTRDYIFFAGRRIAWRDSSGNVYYYFVDAIGSTRTVTDATGTTCFNADYYPYGQENDYNTSCSPTYKFTGYEFDSETGNYYAYARYYSPSLGRFLSADPLGGNIADPQSLNRYAYVLNDPETFIDPLGLKCTRSPDGQTIDDGTQPVCETTPTYIFNGGPPPTAPWDYYRLLGEATGPNGCGPFGCPKPPPPDTTLYAMMARVAQRAQGRPARPQTQPPTAPSVRATIHQSYTQWSACVGREIGTEMLAVITEGASNGEEPSLPRDSAAAWLKTGAECLRNFPLAALDSSYNGPDPGHVFELPPFPLDLYYPYK